MITLTPSAAAEIRRQASLKPEQESSAKIYLHIEIKPGGCKDFYYSFELGKGEEEAKQYYESEGIGIAVAQESENHLKGLKIDYAEDLMGGGFRFLNPNIPSQGSCSCSYSFILPN